MVNISQSWGNVMVASNSIFSLPLGAGRWGSVPPFTCCTARYGSMGRCSVHVADCQRNILHGPSAQQQCQCSSRISEVTDVGRGSAIRTLYFISVLDECAH